MKVTGARKDKFYEKIGNLTKKSVANCGEKLTQATHVNLISKQDTDMVMMHIQKVFRLRNNYGHNDVFFEVCNFSMTYSLAINCS